MHCSNGSADQWNYCMVNGAEECASCNYGYYLLNEKCTKLDPLGRFLNQAVYIMDLKSNLVLGNPNYQDYGKKFGWYYYQYPAWPCQQFVIKKRSFNRYTIEPLYANGDVLSYVTTGRVEFTKYSGQSYQEFEIKDSKGFDEFKLQIRAYPSAVLKNVYGNNYWVSSENTYNWASLYYHNGKDEGEHGEEEWLSVKLVTDVEIY